MTRSINNLLILLFSVLYVTDLGYYNLYISEIVSREYTYKPIYLIGNLFLFVVLGIFMYNFLVKDVEFSIIALILGAFVLIIMLLLPQIAWYLIHELFINIFNSNGIWDVGAVICTTYAVLFAKKIKKGS